MDETEPTTANKRRRATGMKNRYEHIKVCKVKNEARYACRLTNGYLAGYFVCLGQQWFFHNYGFFEGRLTCDQVKLAIAIWTDISDFLGQLNAGGRPK